ncbi:MAG: polysaccharide biosynthesis/export family protein [Rhodomicrobium sp.]
MKAITCFSIILTAILLAGCPGPEDRPAALYVSDPPDVSAGEYRLASGDQIRLIVFDQATLSNKYNIDASGHVSIPLVGAIRANGKTTRELEAAIVSRLKERDLVTDPKVAVEVATYRPFSILGEVKTPGRYPYAPGMTVEAAVAMAGGYTLHANADQIRVTRQAHTETLPPTSTFMPGDTIYITERWY